MATMTETEAIEAVCALPPRSPEWHDGAAWLNGFLARWFLAGFEDDDPGRARPEHMPEEPWMWGWRREPLHPHPR